MSKWPIPAYVMSSLFGARAAASIAGPGGVIASAEQTCTRIGHPISPARLQGLLSGIASASRGVNSFGQSKPLSYIAAYPGSASGVVIAAVVPGGPTMGIV